MTLSISYYDLGTVTGEMAAKILAEGADVSTMEIQYAPFAKKFNKTNCDILGITVPETYEAAAYSLNLNYIPCFKSLLDWYKEHDKARHKELYSLMMTILRRTENITDEKRQSYYDEINR